MADITHIFGGVYTVPSAPPPIPRNHEQQVIAAIIASGLEPPKIAHLDGKIHRFSANGKKSDDSGWYIIYPDATAPAGAFGDWRTGITHVFKAEIGRTLSAQETAEITKRIENAKIARDKERDDRNKRAANECKQIWDGALSASADHPYLQKKHLSSPFGARVTGDGRLIVPMVGPDGSLRNLQYIDHNGEKRFHSGAIVTGSRHIINGNSDKTYLCEGFATGASIYTATGATVICAMSANNLPPVAGSLTGKIIVVADNDESDTGQTYGKLAADAIGAQLIIPPSVGDANDYAQHSDLSALLNPPITVWLEPADEFSTEQKPIRWLIKKWFQSDGLAMIHGPSGSGKTFVVLDLCCRIAGGFDRWMGETVKNGAVVYLAGEGHHGLRQRIAAWKQHNNCKNLQMWIGRHAIDLNEPSYTAQAIDYLRRLPVKPVLVVIDTLHRFLSGDENTAKDAKTMIDACNAIQREFGCAVWLVHHTGVSEEAQHRARGSSAWKGALDNEVNIQRDKNSNTIIMSNPKQKDGELQEPKFLDLQQVPITGWLDEDNEQVISAVIVEGQKLSDKKDSKLIDKIIILKKVWDANGSPLSDNGAPFVTRDQVVEYLIEIGKTERAATHQVSMSKENGLIHSLIKENIILHHETENEYELIDHALVSQWKFCSGKQ